MRKKTRIEGERSSRQKRGKAENWATKDSTKKDVEAPGVPLLVPPGVTIHSRVHFLNLLSKKKPESQTFYLRTLFLITYLMNKTL